MPNYDSLTAVVGALEERLTPTLSMFVPKTSSTKDVIFVIQMFIMLGRYQLEGRLPSQVFVTLATGVVPHHG